MHSEFIATRVQVSKAAKIAKTSEIGMMITPTLKNCHPLTSRPSLPDRSEPENCSERACDGKVRTEVDRNQDDLSEHRLKGHRAQRSTCNQPQWEVIHNIRAETHRNSKRECSSGLGQMEGGC